MPTVPIYLTLQAAPDEIEPTFVTVPEYATFRWVEIGGQVISEAQVIEEPAPPPKRSRSLEAPCAELEYIDSLLAKLWADEKVEVESPLGRKWKLSTFSFYNSTRHALQVQFFDGYIWRDLNPGWKLVSQPRHDVEAEARVVLGQIFLGERASGRRLEHLHCGTQINDAIPGT